jgi:hypothetical protein
LKTFYGKPYERKNDDLDRGCDLQTINQFSDQDGLDAAAGGLNYGEIHNHRQSSTIECNENSVIGTISLDSEKGLKNYAEEVIMSKGFGKFYVIREINSLISMNFKRRVKKKTLEQT